MGRACRRRVAGAHACASVRASVRACARKQLRGDDVDTCPLDGCGADAHVNEYDGDDDAYLVLCDNGHRMWITIDDETWK